MQGTLLPTVPGLARLRLSSTDAQSIGRCAWIGFVYEYQNPNAYYEVVFSPAGVAQLRQMKNGVLRLVRTAAYKEGGKNVWFDVALIRRGWSTAIRVNGNDVFGNVGQSEFVSGSLGLVTHNTTARFDHVDEKGLYGNQPFTTSFNSPSATGQSPDAGLWQVASGVYSSDVQANAFSLSFVFPENSSLFQLRDFGLRAKLFNPYGAEGNLVGLLWNYKRFDYNEVVFTPTGLAMVNRVTAGNRATVATARIPILKRKWFEAEVEVEDLPDGQWAVSIRLDGKPLFTRLQGEAVLPGGFHEGYVGLVTHWSPGQFDNVKFRVGGFAPTYVQHFDTQPRDVSVASGVWETSSGTLQSTALGKNDIALLPTGSASAASGIAGSEIYTYTPSSVYRARLSIAQNAANSSVGLITNYSGNGEYYETIFTAAGDVLINKVLQGATVRQAQAHHGVEPNTWFDVELRRVGTKTTLYVNGAKLLADVPQGQLAAGRVGLITHSAQASYDRVSWFELR